jgi:hypothetical protein
MQSSALHSECQWVDNVPTLNTCTVYGPEDGHAHQQYTFCAQPVVIAISTIDDGTHIRDYAGAVLNLLPAWPESSLGTFAAMSAALGHFVHYIVSYEIEST